MRKPRNSAKCLVITMLALIGLINGSVLPVAVQSTTVVEAGDPNSHGRSRADRRRDPDSPDRWTRSLSTVTGGPTVSAPFEPDDSLPESSTPGTNGKIAFAMTYRTSQEIYVMNADGSSQINLTNNPVEDLFPAWSRDGSRIAFTSFRDGDREIYVMNADGSNQTRLTSSPGADDYPAWSPDGSKIAFATIRDANTEIYVMNADGSNQTRLTNNPGFDFSPAWSPDGTRIAFLSGASQFPNSNWEIYVMNANGSNQTRLTSDPTLTFNTDPAWSPDGSRIAFARNSQIYVMNADGSNQTRLTNHPDAIDLNPAWSPNGATIAFTRDHSQIYVMNADGSNQTSLTSGSDPAWSPDGARIVFTRGPFETTDIFVINADGSNQTRLTTDPERESDPTWSPDGTRIAFISSRDGDDEIYVMNADGSNQTRLTTNPANDYDAAWSPDGNRIAFVRWHESQFLSEIYVMNADGSNPTRLTNNLAFDFAFAPTWSPDGTRIAFLSGTSQFPDTSWEIYVMNADGSNQINLTNNSAGDFSPSWSPSGAKIAFASDRDGNLGSQIHVMNADGSNPTRLTNNLAFDFAFAPTWSPDGTRIAFTTAIVDDSGFEGFNEIYLMNADGSNQARLTSGFLSGPIPPCWSPDGTRIAFTLGGGGFFSEIYLMNTDGSNQTRLTNGFEPDWQALPTTSTSTVQFSASGYSVSESTASVSITVIRTGDTSTEATVDYASSDTAGPNNCNVFNGAASSRCDYATAVGTLRFAAGETTKTISISIVDDAYAEGPETLNLTLSNPSGATLGSPSTATITITDNDTSSSNSNPIDDASFFVRQHYLDFLNRESDPGGLAYWTDQITQCGSDLRCVHERRMGVSAAFFSELEFQDTGYFIYRFYKASFGRQPNFAEFRSDRSQVPAGANLEPGRQAFADQWVQRTAFVQAYPSTMSNTEFVNKLFDTAGLTASWFDAERQQKIAAMNAGRSRALVLRDVIEIPDFRNIPDPTNREQVTISQYNPAFVLMQYFGYLQRNIDQGGYDFWLDILNNREPNNYRSMVCTFITSREYQLRFGSVVTRSNADCGQ